METLKTIKEKLGTRIKEWNQRSDTRLYVTLDSADLKESAGILFNDSGCRYIIVTGMENDDNFELLYHFSLDSAGAVISLRVFLDKQKPVVESLTGLIPGISYIEREICELLGITFINHPNMKKFLLPDNWPDGDYPLRKSRKGKTVG